MSRLNVLLLIAVAAAAAFTGCGPAAQDGMAGPGTGVVTFAVKDAPLESLQALTIDITGATLHGVDGTPDFQVFPQGGPTVLQVDLLALQGVAQLLSTATVPAGRYNKLNIDYTNPQGIDTASAPQVITQRQGFMIGMFMPHFVVAPGSVQSVLIDIDVSQSYHDTGGNTGFLTPLVQLFVNQPMMPVQEFTGTVLSTNPGLDQFTMDAVQQAGMGPPVPLGTVTVQCESATVFNDGNGGITVGGVAALVAVNDMIEVSGVLTAGVIQAGSVTLLAQSSALQATALPAVQRLSGTIMEVNTTASTLTVRIRNVIGMAAAPFGDMVIDVVAATTIHRGAQMLVLGDLTAGNFCHVSFDAAGAASDIGETASFITGTVVSTSVGGGAGGSNRVVFDPRNVNQIPVSAMPFVPSPLTVDIPGQPLPPVGATFRVYALFDGTATLTLDMHTGGFLGVPPALPPLP